MTEWMVARMCNTPEGSQPPDQALGHDKQKPPRCPSRPSGAWRSLAEASESIASLVAVVLIHGPTSSGGVRHYRTTPTRFAQLWRARNVADYSVFAAGRSLLGPLALRGCAERSSHAAWVQEVTEGGDEAHSLPRHRRDRGVHATQRDYEQYQSWTDAGLPDRRSVPVRPSGPSRRLHRARRGWDERRYHRWCARCHRGPAPGL